MVQTQKLASNTTITTFFLVVLPFFVCFAFTWRKKWTGELRLRYHCLSLNHNLLSATKINKIKYAPQYAHVSPQFLYSISSAIYDWPALYLFIELKAIVEIETKTHTKKKNRIPHYGVYILFSICYTLHKETQNCPWPEYWLFALILTIHFKLPSIYGCFVDINLFANVAFIAVVTFIVTLAVHQISNLLKI